MIKKNRYGPCLRTYAGGERADCASPLCRPPDLFGVRCLYNHREVLLDCMEEQVSHLPVTRPICCYHKVARIRGENVYLLYTIIPIVKSQLIHIFYER